MTENIKIDALVLQDYVAQYKASFAEHRLGDDSEIYKWKAVKCFQDNWDIDAQDFSAMLKSSLAKTYNLLSSAQFFPKKMLEVFADAHPDTMRDLFRALFDEDMDVTRRVKAFEEGAGELLNAYPTLKMTYQNPNSISTYLWLRYPDKYYIYKYSVIKSNAQALCGIDLPSGKLDRMKFGFSLYDAICEILSKDAELIEMSRNSLTEDCYADDSLKTLTIDIGYYISKYSTIPFSSAVDASSYVTITELLAEFEDYVLGSGKKGNTPGSYRIAISRTLNYLGYNENISSLDIIDMASKIEYILNDFKSNKQIIMDKMRPFFEAAQSYLDDGFVSASLPLFSSFLTERIADVSVAAEASNNRTPVNMGNKNVILCGTPGTGKTYSTVQYAVSIIEETPLEVIKTEDYQTVFSRYLNYKDNGLIAFTTFHQSFGYEEFIEGIRPVVSSDDSSDEVRNIEYEVRDGIFKAFCDKAGTPVGGGASTDFGIGKNPTVWKVSLEGTGNNITRSECMENSHIRIGWDGYGETISGSTDYSKDGGSTVLNAFYNRMQVGDIVFSCYSSKTIDAIGVVTGEAEWHSEYQHYKRLRTVKWLVKGIDEDIVDLNAGKTMTLSTVYKLSVSVSDAIQILKKTTPQLFTPTVKIPNRVFIIDEINRGNISKIFGELITLIEPTKRIGAPEELRALLPYSGKHFGVPENVYVLGTMNTADRSIAMIDTALRRRFDFVEMQPDSNLLRDVIVGGIDIAEMLDTMNRRITVLLDHEHTIGHSYLLPLKDDSSVEKLAEIFEGKIMPLLQEYFYDDYEKIQLVLGDNQKSDDNTRFVIKMIDTVKLFGNADIDYPEFYEINREAFKRIEAYAFIN